MEIILTFILSVLMIFIFDILYIIYLVLTDKKANTIDDYIGVSNENKHKARNYSR